MQILGFEITRRSRRALVVKENSVAVPVTAGGWFGLIREAFAGAWQRNITIDSTESMLAYSAVYSCISLISKDIGKLRPCLKQRSKQDIWEDTENPAYSPVLRKPNRYQTRNLFYEQWVISKLVNGNAYALKQRDSRNVVEALYILNPRLVLPLVAPDGEVFYQVGIDNLAGLRQGAPMVPASEMIHDRHTCLFHPLVGVGPLYACGMSATQGNRIQANSSTFFENMSRPSGQLTAPGFIKDETAARLKEEFEKNFSGSNMGRILVSGDGLKFEPLTMPAEQAQLIEQLRWTVEDIARAFQMPLYKIGAGQVPSHIDVGALNLEYYQQTLQPLIEGIETLLDEGLGLSLDLGVEFDLEGLLRMDPKSRAETREIEVRAALLAPNEGRKCENRPPVPGGDTVYLQQQNYSLAALAKRDASADPFGKAQSAAPQTPPQDPAAMQDAAAAEARELLAHIAKGFACPA